MGHKVGVILVVVGDFQRGVALARIEIYSLSLR